MSKKLFLLLVLSITTLASCSLGGGSTLPSSNTKTYSTANFSIQYPFDWEIIEKNKFTSSIPEDVIVGFRSNIKNEIFTANYNISVMILEKDVSAKDFGLNTLYNLKKKLIEFKEINNEESTVNTGTGPIKTFTSTFQGKKTMTDPTVQFTQLYVSNNGAVYTITGSSLPNEDESIVKTMEEMIDSFSLK